MEYAIYKLDFQTGVHFGEGMLNDSATTFHADQLFSALYIEALKMGKAEEFLAQVQHGRLLFSDAFPYIGQQYLLPKPMLYVEPKEQGVSEQKKAYKKLRYLPVEWMKEFLDGNIDLTKKYVEEYGCFQQQTMASVRQEEETMPYRVGTYYFLDGCGLYVVISYEGKEEKELFEELMESLSYTGIGGKKSSGLGKFSFVKGKMSDIYLDYLKYPAEMKMLLSTALPRETELTKALEGASYQLLKRSGFVASDQYASEWMKKKDIYVFQAGSCFRNPFEGDIYDVSNGGRHPVYRYAKSMFMGV